MIVLAVLLLAASVPQHETLAVAAQAFDDAQFHHDRATLDRMLAPDFLFVTRAGEADRNAFIAAMTTPGEVPEPFVITHRRILPLGTEGGVVSGEGLERGTQDGKPFVSHFRYSDVFARRDGHWVVVYTQVTGLPNP